MGKPGRPPKPKDTPDFVTIDVCVCGYKKVRGETVAVCKNCDRGQMTGYSGKVIEGQIILERDM